MSKAKQKVITVEEYEDHPLFQLNTTLDYLLPLYVKACAESSKRHKTISRRLRQLDTMRNENKISREERDKKTEVLYAKSGYRKASDEFNALSGALILTAEKVLDIEPPNAEAVATHAKAVATLANIYAQDVSQELPQLLHNVLRIVGAKPLPGGLV